MPLCSGEIVFVKHEIHWEQNLCFKSDLLYFYIHIYMYLFFPADYVS